MSNDISDFEPMQPDDFMVHPAVAVHFDGSVEGETMVEVRGMGPLNTTAATSAGSR